MKKILLIIGIFIVFGLTFSLKNYLFSPNIEMKIEDIKIESYKLNPYADERVYNFNLNDVGKIDLNRVFITCKLKNTNLAKLSYIFLTFGENQILPEIILGDQLDTTKVESVNMESFDEETLVFNFLIDRKGYSDEEIINMIQGVDLYVISRYPEDKVVSKKPVKCKVN